MKRRPPSSPPAPPGSTAEAAPFVRNFVVKLYDLQDGEGVNKRLVADILFRAAFDALDGLPVELRQKVDRLVHEGSYRRMTEDETGDSSASDASIPSRQAILRPQLSHPQHCVQYASVRFRADGPSGPVRETQAAGYGTRRLRRRIRRGRQRRQ